MSRIRKYSVLLLCYVLLLCCVVTAPIPAKADRAAQSPQFMPGVTEEMTDPSFWSALAEDPDLPAKAIEKVEPFLCTDLSVENFTDMVNHLTDYELLPIVCPTGEYVEAEPFNEFHMDPASLSAGIRRTFCKE